ncbi:565_t:CDS:1, partial [Paraglomus occultum]
EAENEMNLAIFNRLRKHIFQHHFEQVKTAQTAINEAVGKMREELQQQLEDIKSIFKNDYAVLVTAQNIIDRNLAELVTFINELTTRTALAVEGPK